MSQADDNKKVHRLDPRPNILKLPRGVCGCYPRHLTTKDVEVTCTHCIRVMGSPKRRTPTPKRRGSN